MNKIIKRIYENDNFPFLILSILMLFYHWMMQGFIGDDYAFSQALNDSTLGEYVKNCWNTWSSRIILQSVTVVITHVSFAIWKIMDVLLITLMGYSISVLLSVKNKRRVNYILVCYILMYNFMDMSTAGWAVTTMIYLWPLSVGLYSLLSLRMAIDKRPMNWYQVIIFTLCALYGGNQEQMAIVLFSAYTAALIYLIIKKMKWNYVILPWTASVVSIAIIFLCPGNALRKTEEVAASFADYFNISFLDKLEIGYSSTLYQLVVNGNRIFFFLSLILAVRIWLTYKEGIYRFVSAIPLAGCIIFSFGSSIFVNYFPGISRLIGQINTHGMITLANFDSRKSYLGILILGIICSMVLVSIYILYGNSIKSFWMILLILTGFATRVVMGFTPTVWRSETRTYLFLNIALLISAAYLTYGLMEKNKYTGKIINYAITAFAAGSFLNHLLCLIEG